MSYEHFIAVDWSAVEGPTDLGEDSVWVAHGRRHGTIATWNLRTRSAAFASILDVLLLAFAAGERALVMFDFAYGYPDGVAALLGLAGSDPWRAVWKHVEGLAANPAIGGGDRNNGVNRWRIANALN